MSYTVALTGGIGSGKSTIARLFAALGVDLVDADIIARQVVAPGTPALAAIVRHFGGQVLQDDKSLNRRWLRTAIFADRREKAWLDALLHPLIHQQTRIGLANATSVYVLWVIPLLLESQRQQDADRILVVDVPEEMQIQRTMQRDGISRQQAELMLASQATRSARLACADDIIDNTGSPQMAEAQVQRLHHYYQQLATSNTHKDIRKE